MSQVRGYSSRYFHTLLLELGAAAYNDIRYHLPGESTTVVPVLHSETM